MSNPYNPFQPKIMLISFGLHILVFVGFSVGNPFGGSTPPKKEYVMVNISTPAPVKEIIKAKPKPPPKKKVKPKKKKPPIKNPIDKPEIKEKGQPEEKTTEKSEADPEYVIDEPESTADTSTEISPTSYSEFSGAFDAPDFEYPDWNYQGFRKIARAWRNQAYAPHILSCTIYFRVLKSGRIYSIRIKKSSGNPVYDRGCKDAVLRANPLPALPREYAHEEIGVSLVFPWKP